jgi:predicted enzyme related to lactoylglutathione lyase
MTVQRVEVGLVSPDTGLVDFLATVFDLERLPSYTTGQGELHRLQAPGAVIKVMVPNETPVAAEAAAMFALTGLRYLTMYVEDLDPILERALAHGASIQHGPMEMGPVRIVVLEDPNGGIVEIVGGAP